MFFSIFCENSEEVIMQTTSIPVVILLGELEYLTCLENRYLMRDSTSRSRKRILSKQPSIGIYNSTGYKFGPESSTLEHLLNTALLPPIHEKPQGFSQNHCRLERSH